MNRYVSMREIARRLGVNPSTVSRALKNDPAISPATRKSVRDLAENMGFTPSPSLSVLNEMRWSGRRRIESPSIAYLTWHRYDDNRMVQAFIKAYANMGGSTGFIVEPFYLEDYTKPAAGLEVLYQRGVQGLILGRVNHPDDIGACDWSRFCVVAAAHVRCLQPFHLVMTNPSTPLRQTWEIATRAGAKRIGLVIKHDPHSWFFEELRGRLHVENESIPASRRIPLHVYSGSPEDLAAERLVKWMQRHKPDTVIGYSDELYHELVRCGYAIPDQVWFASLGRLDPQASLSGRREVIAGLTVDFDLLAHLTLERLSSLVRRNERGVPSAPLRLFVDRYWIPGESLPEGGDGGSG